MSAADLEQFLARSDRRRRSQLHSEPVVPNFVDSGSSTQPSHQESQGENPGSDTHVAPRTAGNIVDTTSGVPSGDSGDEQDDAMHGPEEYRGYYFDNDADLLVPVSSDADRPRDAAAGSNNEKASDSQGAECGDGEAHDGSAALEPGAQDDFDLASELDPELHSAHGLNIGRIALGSLSDAMGLGLDDEDVGGIGALLREAAGDIPGPSSLAPASQTAAMSLVPHAFQNEERGHPTQLPSEVREDLNAAAAVAVATPAASGTASLQWRQLASVATETGGAPGGRGRKAAAKNMQSTPKKQKASHKASTPVFLDPQQIPNIATAELYASVIQAVIHECQRMFLFSDFPVEQALSSLQNAWSTSLVEKGVVFALPGSQKFEEAVHGPALKKKIESAAARIATPFHAHPLAALAVRDDHVQHRRYAVTKPAAGTTLRAASASGKYSYVQQQQELMLQSGALPNGSRSDQSVAAPVSDAAMSLSTAVSAVDSDRLLLEDDHPPKTGLGLKRPMGATDAGGALLLPPSVSSSSSASLPSIGAPSKTYVLPAGLSAESARPGGFGRRLPAQVLALMSKTTSAAGKHSLPGVEQRARHETESATRQEKKSRLSARRNPTAAMSTDGIGSSADDEDGSSQDGRRRMGLLTQTNDSDDVDDLFIPSFSSSSLSSASLSSSSSSSPSSSSPTSTTRFGAGERAMPADKSKAKTRDERHHLGKGRSNRGNGNGSSNDNNNVDDNCYNNMEDADRPGDHGIYATVTARNRSFSKRPRMVVTRSQDVPSRRHRLASNSSAEASEGLERSNMPIPRPSARSAPQIPQVDGSWDDCPGNARSDSNQNARPQPYADWVVSSASAALSSAAAAAGTHPARTDATGNLSMRLAIDEIRQLEAELGEPVQSLRGGGQHLQHSPSMPPPPMHSHQHDRHSPSGSSSSSSSSDPLFVHYSQRAMRSGRSTMPSQQPFVVVEGEPSQGSSGASVVDDVDGPGDGHRRETKLKHALQNVRSALTDRLPAAHDEDSDGCGHCDNESPQESEDELYHSKHKQKRRKTQETAREHTSNALSTNGAATSAESEREPKRLGLHEGALTHFQKQIAVSLRGSKFPLAAEAGNFALAERNESATAAAPAPAPPMPSSSSPHVSHDPFLDDIVLGVDDFEVVSDDDGHGVGSSAAACEGQGRPGKRRREAEEVGHLGTLMCQRVRTSADGPWAINGQAGILHIGGRDFAFSRCIGELHW